MRELTRQEKELAAKALRHDALKALHCLYIAVESPVADDVNQKVRAYIDYLEAKVGMAIQPIEKEDK